MRLTLAAGLSPLFLLPTAVHSLLWFNDAPNNLGDFDGLTTKDGKFWLRYNNGACAGGKAAAANAPCLHGAGGHCRMGIHSYGSASSPDGVHWTDHGTMMTEFATLTACPKTGSGSGSVWQAIKPGTGTGTGGSNRTAEGVDEFVINFSEGGKIYFMTAPTPGGPWTRVGPLPNKTNSGGFGPKVAPSQPRDGTQWYNGRWDTANGWPAPASADPAAPKIYFWISATAIHDNTKQVGHASSADGVLWTAEPPAVVTDWGNHSFTGGPFESGGCAYVATAKRWYCLNGFRGNWMLVDHTRGMGMFVSDRPGGPYAIAEKNPLIMSYKSCAYLPGSCDAATYFARFWLRYDVADPSSPEELLVVHQSYSQSTALTYLAPLKQAVVDKEGTMRLHYWPKNDLMKGPAIPAAQLALLSSAAGEEAGDARAAAAARSAGDGGGGEPGVATDRVVIMAPLNNRNGTVLEGKMASCAAGGAMVFHAAVAAEEGELAAAAAVAEEVRSLEYPPVANTTYGYCGTVEVGVSYGGHDIQHWTAANLGGIDQCCAACAAHADKKMGGCKFWSMDRGTSDCYLKTAKPPGPNSGFPMTVSGTPGKGCRPSVPAPPPPPPPVDYEIAVDAALLMTVSTISGSGNRTLLDTFDRAMPVPAAGEGCSFKLLLRGSMAELYINDVLTAPIALPNTILPGGYTEDGGWAEGLRVPAITVGLSGDWAKATLKGWTMGLPALFPQQ